MNIRELYERFLREVILTGGEKATLEKFVEWCERLNTNTPPALGVNVSEQISAKDKLA